MKRPDGGQRQACTNDMRRVAAETIHSTMGGLERPTNVLALPTCYALKYEYVVPRRTLGDLS